MKWSAPVLAVALAGCLFMGHCELRPEEVQWRDPDFAPALAGVAGWNVTGLPAAAGFATDDERLDAWGANVTDVGTDLGSHLRLDISADGTLRVHEVPEDQPEPREAVLAALAQVTDGNASERAAWTDALFASGNREGHGEGRDGTIVVYRGYRATIDPDRVVVDRLLVDAEFDRPRAAARSGDWSLSLAFPTVEAHRGPWTFHADPGGENRFHDARWEGEFPQEDALSDFHEAYARLGLGPAPEHAGVGGTVC